MQTISSLLVRLSALCHVLYIFFFFNLGPFDFNGVCKVKEDKMYLELSLSPFGTWRKFRSKVGTSANSHGMIEANPMKEFVQDLNMRSELTHLKMENLGG